MHPFYVIRACGGVLFLAGALIMVCNLWRDHPRRAQRDEEPPMAQPAYAPRRPGRVRRRDHVLPEAATR